MIGVKDFIKNVRLPFLLFLIIPITISIVHSLFTILCSFVDGFLFYLVLTVPSILIGSSLALIVRCYIKKFRKLFFLVLFILIISFTFFEFYFNPQIYFYNPIFGFYPGTIYDEALSVSLKLVGYRILNIVYFGGILLLLISLIKKGQKLSKQIFAFSIIIIAIIFYSLSSLFGYSTTFDELNKRLGKTAETPHFVIHYSAEIDTSLVKTIIMYHEYFYTELSNYFKYSLDNKISSYLFTDDEQKLKLFGTANADVAKPWQNTTYITYSDYRNTLRHELGHVFSARFGQGIFKIADNMNMAATEGIAVAADPFYGENTVDYMAALAYQNGFKINVNELFNGLNFFGQTSSLSYIYAGAFSKFLIKNFGIEKFEKYYSNLNLEKTYGNSSKKITKTFYNYLENIKIISREDQAKYYFGRKAIAHKVCSRFVADRLELGWESLNKKNYSKAETLFREILNTTENYSAAVGLSDCYNKLNNVNGAIALLKRYIKFYKSTAYYYNLEFKLADLLAENNLNVKADSIYNRIVKQNPNRTFYYLANLRLTLIKNDSLLFNYLKGSDTEKYLILKKVNEKSTNYYAIPALINLAGSVDKEYQLFLKQFSGKIVVDDYESSFAMYRLSNFMMQNFDFYRARKMAAFSLRYKSDKNFYEILNDNYNAVNWIYKNSALLNNIIYYNN